MSDYNRCKATNPDRLQCWGDAGHIGQHFANYGNTGRVTWPASRARMPKAREWYATLSGEFRRKAELLMSRDPVKAAEAMSYAAALQSMADEPDRRGGRRAARYVNGKAGKA